MKRYVDVIVPLPLANYYTYSLPAEMEGMVQVGSRVIVPFGQKKFYTAIVAHVHYAKPDGYETKEVQELLDANPVLLPIQLSFWEWLAEYYLCTVGDVYKAAMPSGMKLESETIIRLNEEFESDVPLLPKEQLLIELLLSDKEQCITQLQRNSSQKNIMPTIQSLLARGVIGLKEELKRSYKPKMESRVKFANDQITEKQLNIYFSTLSKAPKQLDILMKYVELSGWFLPGEQIKEVSKKALLEQSGHKSTSLNGLIEKGIFTLYNFEVGRLDAHYSTAQELHPLHDSQKKALEEIQQSFGEKNVCLLHGVTGSGKTEVYIHLIEQAMKEGKQVLYLLPEIALTTQITERLRRVFGNRLGVYHSKFPDAERVEIWQKQLSEGGYDLILGVRSSIFLPFSRLGLVIVDEEHESSYKQQDPAPRYHARNSAIVLASKFGAKVLLGTATPSIESYYNAREGKYGLVELKERFREMELPHIERIDVKRLLHQKRMKEPFSPYLIEQMRGALDRKEQIILFQNRRGFAPMIECQMCSWVPKCKNCDVSLTFHRGISQLTCHYCGYTYQLPRVCPACGGVHLQHKGFGTERIEEDIKILFPEVKTGRMDLDTTRTRTAYERIIADFEAGRTQILIGTQMVSKGLDFDHVSVVGILNADALLNYPDFRSHERAFQLMAQVAGRAGRKHKRGLVVLQTKSPDLPLIEQVMAHNYEQLYADQLAERALFRYPPFYRLIYVYLKHRKEQLLDEAADVMANCLRGGLGERVLGPDKPVVGRIQSLFIKKMVIKVEQGASMAKVSEYLREVQRSVISDERFRSLLVYYDVDPQ
ncbi:MAG: replication restart helicase PriA [Phocaeicola sp.]